MLNNKRVTKQKQTVFEYLEKNINKHFTIDDIVKTIENCNINIGKTTIYRIINNLIDEGKVIKIPFDNKQGYCYQYIKCEEQKKNHYHLICEDCGGLVHYENNDIEKIQNDALTSKNFSINIDKIVFYGKCNKCNKINK